MDILTDLRDADARGVYPPQNWTTRAANEIEQLRRKYNELIMAVASKFPNETRHETALRYIKKAEEQKEGACAKEC